MERLLTAVTGLASAAALVSAPFVSTLPGFALTGPEINQLASQTSVHILVSPDGETISGSGSGFIISRNGNKYYVLTNSHVTNGGQYYLLGMHDNEKVPTNKVYPFAGLDLAVIEFESNRNYPIATLAPSIQTGQDMFVSGWPPPHPSSGEMVRQFTYGKVSAQLTQAFAQGYQLSYSAPTNFGMSGGQVIDASGRVVAIHGLGGAEDPGAIAQRLGATNSEDPLVQVLSAVVKPGLNYGIPISTFINNAAANGLYLDLTISYDPVQPLGAAIADANDADPTSPRDRVENAYADIAILQGWLNVVRDGAGVVCQFIRFC